MPPSSPTIVGSAVDTIVWSSAARNMPSISAPKIGRSARPCGACEGVGTGSVVAIGSGRCTRSAEGGGAGEGNRTPIFGLGSQRLGHWTTPARAVSLAWITDSCGASPARIDRFLRRLDDRWIQAWPSGAARVTLASTIAGGMRPRAYWPVTLAAALLVGLLAYGLTTSGTDTTLDSAVANGDRPAPPAAT